MAGTGGRGAIGTLYDTSTIRQVYTKSIYVLALFPLRCLTCLHKNGQILEPIASQKLGVVSCCGAGPVVGGRTYGPST